MCNYEYENDNNSRFDDDYYRKGWNRNDVPSNYIVHSDGYCENKDIIGCDGYVDEQGFHTFM